MDDDDDDDDGRLQERQVHRGTKTRRPICMFLMTCSRGHADMSIGTEKRKTQFRLLVAGCERRRALTPYE